MVRVFAVCAMMAMPLLLDAQTSAGAIGGVVRDATGAPVPQARLTATNTGTNLTSAFVTDESGNYNFPSMIPGTYRLSAEKAGFKKVEVAGVLVAVNHTARIDLTLIVGDVAALKFLW